MQSPTKILSKSSIVKELITASRSEWYENMIKNIFWKEEAKAILSIPFGTKNLEDKLNWAIIENGLFLVKNVYILAITRNKEKQGCTSNAKQQPNKWKYIRLLSVLPKVQNFI